MSDYPAGTVLGPWPMDLGGLGLDQVDGQGGQWSVTEFQGKGGPPQAIEVNQRETGHGAWVGGRFWAAKPYSITGSYTGDSEAQRWAAEQRLLAACPLAGTSLVMQEEVARQTWVIPNGEVAIDPVGVYAFTFQVPLVAPDPFRYGTTERTASTGAPAATGGTPWPLTWPATWTGTATSGVLTLENAGNATAYPTFDVYGPLDDFTLVNQATGQALTVDNPAGQTVADGEHITVDTARRRILLMGTGSRRSWMHGQWFALPPGVTGIGFYTSAPNATTYVTAAWRDTYL